MLELFFEGAIGLALRLFASSLVIVSKFKKIRANSQGQARVFVHMLNER